MMKNSYCLSVALGCSLLLASGGRLAAADHLVNVAGSWQFSVETPRGTVAQTLTIQQDGGKIKGTMKGARGEAPLEGAVDGNKINFTVKRETPNGTFTLEYAGTVEGDSMAGTVHSERFDGKWTAARSKN
jgi:hypothetical protein